MRSGYVHAFQFPDGCSIHLYQGSLAEVRADALVSSDDNHLSAGGGVSAALARMAGTVVAMERERIAREDRPSLGDVVCTSAGGLSCRYLYHAITIDFDRRSFQSEASLRRLVANLLDRATADSVSSLGIPALGTGAAAFELGRASEVIVEELVERQPHSSVRRVILALLGDEAERDFHENLLRAVGMRRATDELRRRNDSQINIGAPAAWAVIGAALVAPLDGGLVREESEQCRDSAPEAAVCLTDLESFDGETVEQLATRFDERRLRRIGGERPRLVSGLTDIILRHASPEEIEQELLSLEECYGFRGTMRQRLMEFLYLSEEKSRLALGPALFRTKNLRTVAGELGIQDVAHLDHEALVTEILRDLGFNMMVPPRGSSEAIQRVERLLGALQSKSPNDSDLRSALIESGRILESFLLDLLKLYSQLFWGESAEEELVARGLIPKRREGSAIHHLSLGQLRDALTRLSGMLRKDKGMKQRWTAAGRKGCDIFQFGTDGDSGCDGLGGLSDLIAARNDAAHDRKPGDHPSRKPVSPRQGAVHAGASGAVWGLATVVSMLETLRSFCLVSRREGFYPEVFRYEGTFENRHGERFLHFLDESEQLRKVRSDEAINPRRHYFCFATNNPVHLFPILLPKD